jgi:hypothetical protein
MHSFICVGLQNIQWWSQRESEGLWEAQETDGVTKYGHCYCRIVAWNWKTVG